MTNNTNLIHINPNEGLPFHYLGRQVRLHQPDFGTIIEGELEAWGFDEEGNFLVISCAAIDLDDNSHLELI